MEERPLRKQLAASPDSPLEVEAVLPQSPSAFPLNQFPKPPRHAGGYPQRAQERSQYHNRQKIFDHRLHAVDSLLPLSPKPAPFFDSEADVRNMNAPPTPQASEPLRPPILIAAHPLTASRYMRHLPLRQVGVEGQSTLLRSRVLIIGLGGLGSPATLYLAAAGVGTLGLIDNDAVEFSNLQRQIAHSEARVGRSKAASAAEAIRGLNSDVEVIEYQDRFETQNVRDIMDKGWDLVLDCSDNPATRYLVSDACVAWEVPLISGAAQQLDGQLMILSWNENKGVNDDWPCYRCVFPNPPKPETVQGCDEIGILGTTVGTIGVMMAGEGIKVLVSKQQENHESPVANQSTRGKRSTIGGLAVGFKPTMLLFSAFAQPMVRTVGLRRRRKDCLACSGQIDKDTIYSGRVDYVAFCGVQEDPQLLHENERITAAEFIKQFDSTGHQPTVIDVREKPEFDMGPTIKGSNNTPISKILRSDFNMNSLQGDNITGDGVETADKAAPTYIVCQRGNDSQYAVQKMKAQGEAVGRKVMDIKGGIEALAMLETGKP